jgi:hypothetical protein
MSAIVQIVSALPAVRALTIQLDCFVAFGSSQ